jgi:hypothetical protein
LRLLSTAGNSYDRAYFGDSHGLSAAVREQQEFKDGVEWDMPMLNVFRRYGGTIRHFWGSEILYVPPEPARSTATTMPLTRSGICSTSLPKDAATFIRG